MTEQQPAAPFISINTFTARAGGLDALIQFQIAETQRMSVNATAHGWLGNEMYRTQGGTDLIVITRFRSPRREHCGRRRHDSCATLMHSILMFRRSRQPRWTSSPPTAHLDSASAPSAENSAEGAEPY